MFVHLNKHHVISELFHNFENSKSFQKTTEESSPTPLPPKFWIFVQIIDREVGYF